MANEEQLARLKQGAEAWYEWREQNREVRVDLSEADLRRANLQGAYLQGANLIGANLSRAKLKRANFRSADLRAANFRRANLREATLDQADLYSCEFQEADLSGAGLNSTDLTCAELNEALLNGADLTDVKLKEANLAGSQWLGADIGGTILADLDLSQVRGLESVTHHGPSSISTDTFALSKGKIPEIFLRGCGLRDWEIEAVKLYNPDLSNEEINNIQYRMYDLRATQALQISPLFISYSHADHAFVDRIDQSLEAKGVRFWRDTHDMKAGRIERQIDRAMHLNPTVLLVLSEHSLGSDWVEHEVRKARALEKELERDVLCPVALDNSWESSRWPQRLMEQIMEYNILDFSAWEDGTKFDATFRKLIDGLELFYEKD